MFKRTISIMLTIVMVMAITVVGTVNSSAVTKPKAPTSVEYSSDYAIGEHFISFKSPSKVDGFHVHGEREDGKKLDVYCWTSNYDNYFYKVGNKYIVQPLTLQDGCLHTLKVRAFNVSKNYKRPASEPTIFGNLKQNPGKAATYSDWSKSIYMANAVTSIKATRVNNNKNLKITWNKIPKVTKYKLSISSIDNKNVNLEYVVNSTSKTIGKIDNIAFKKNKKISAIVVPVAVNNAKVYSSFFKYRIVTIK